MFLDSPTFVSYGIRYYTGQFFKSDDDDCQPASQTTCSLNNMDMYFTLVNAEVVSTLHF